MMRRKRRGLREAGEYGDEKQVRKVSESAALVVRLLVNLRACLKS
jgi:hypothetical protein